MSTGSILVRGGFAVSAASLLCTALLAAQGATTRVSVGTGGTQADAQSFESSISFDGRFVAFASEATNLVAGDTNVCSDVFVHDRVACTTERVSVSSAGLQADDESVWPSLSANGRFVAFKSKATNLVPEENHPGGEIYVRDRWEGTVVRASVSSSGEEGDGESSHPALSAGGRQLAFDSFATNLVERDTNSVLDVFVRGLESGVTARVSLSSAGQEGDGDSFSPSISGDGRFVIFASYASNLCSGDTNGVEDVFVRDRTLGTTRRVSVGWLGQQASGLTRECALSADGRFAAFASYADNLVPGDLGNVDVFVRDFHEGTLERVSASSLGQPADGSSAWPSISADGRYVVFVSSGTNLVTGDGNGVTDVFVHDRLTRATSRASVSSLGVECDQHCQGAGLSGDGRKVLLETASTNLVPGDTNAEQDIFVHDRGSGEPATYCFAGPSSQGCLPAMGFAGTPSASSLERFDVRAELVPNQRSGLLVHSFTPTTWPWLGGWQCVAQPLRRTHLQNSGGSPAPNDCSGSFSFDFNAHIRSGLNPSLVAGVEVFCQYWYRDPGLASGTGLTDALGFVVQP